VPEVGLRHTKRLLLPVFVLATGLSCAPLQLIAQQSATPAVAKSKIIVDTDIGDDIDDAFALALAMRSPELEILGITTAWGDTELRARLVQRFLKENGAPDVLIAPGVPTKSTAGLSQARWAQDGPSFQKQVDAAEVLLQQVRKAPGEMTLVAIGPLTNIG